MKAALFTATMVSFLVLISPAKTTHAGTFLFGGSLQLPDRGSISAIKVVVFKQFPNNTRILVKGDEIDRVYRVLDLEKEGWNRHWHTVPSMPAFLEFVLRSGKMRRIYFDPNHCERGGYFLADGTEESTVDKRFSPNNCDDLMTALMIPRHLPKP